MRIQVGTSGYSYPEWRGRFYPADLPASRMFGFYASRFLTVEINASFYRMPTRQMTAKWRDQAPEGFRYALKAPRRITHDRRLRDCQEAVDQFCDSARELGPALGPLLFQLPPTFRRDDDRLAAFLDELPAGMASAVEFRHDSWLCDAVYARLAGRQVALCVADVGDRATPLVATARHGYLRLRDEGYTPADLDRWAGDILAKQAEWDEVFVFFKHEDQGKGPEFAEAFREALRRRGAQVT